VLPSAKLPIGALLRLPTRTSTRPLTPPAAPEATRATKSRTPPVPKSTLLYCSQSPLLMAPMFWPFSVEVSVMVPDWALNDSASIVPYALRVPPGGLVGGGVVGGVVPPPPRE
jgi:hypothetical protein